MVVVVMVGGGGVHVNGGGVGVEHDMNQGNGILTVCLSVCVGKRSR